MTEKQIILDWIALEKHLKHDDTLTLGIFGKTFVLKLSKTTPDDRMQLLEYLLKWEKEDEKKK